MADLIFGLFGVWGSYCSVLSVMQPENYQQITLKLAWLAVLLIAALYSSYKLVEQYRSKPKFYKNNQEINEYMFKWIRQGGRVAICTRDMSWGNDPKIKSLLIEKAGASELCIFLPKDIPLTKELKKAGAEIFIYPELEHTPTSRFTIIDKDQAYARVAVGRKIDGRHYIEEFSIGRHPVFEVANDLVEVIRKYNEKVRRLSDAH